VRLDINLSTSLKHLSLAQGAKIDAMEIKQMYVTPALKIFVFHRNNHISNAKAHFIPR